MVEVVKRQNIYNEAVVSIRDAVRSMTNLSDDFFKLPQAKQKAERIVVRFVPESYGISDTVSFLKIALPLLLPIVTNYDIVSSLNKYWTTPDDLNESEQQFWRKLDGEYTSLTTKYKDIDIILFGTPLNGDSPAERYLKFFTVFSFSKNFNYNPASFVNNCLLIPLRTLNEKIDVLNDSLALYSAFSGALFVSTFWWLTNPSIFRKVWGVDTPYELKSLDDTLAGINKMNSSNLDLNDSDKAKIVEVATIFDSILSSPRKAIRFLKQISSIVVLSATLSERVWKNKPKNENVMDTISATILKNIKKSLFYIPIVEKIVAFVEEYTRQKVSELELSLLMTAVESAMNNTYANFKFALAKYNRLIATGEVRHQRNLLIKGKDALLKALFGYSINDYISVLAEVGNKNPDFVNIIKFFGVTSVDDLAIRFNRELREVIGDSTLFDAFVNAIKDFDGFKFDDIVRQYSLIRSNSYSNVKTLLGVFHRLYKEGGREQLKNILVKYLATLFPPSSPYRNLKAWGFLLPLILVMRKPEKYLPLLPTLARKYNRRVVDLAFSYLLG